METPLRLSATTSIIFDTNTLISAAVFRKFAGQVYEHCAEHYQLVTSEWILNELAEKLENKFRLPVALQEQILTQFRSDVQVVEPTNALPTESEDPDDNNVLRLALFVEADFLITGDEKHLLVLKKVGHTEIISPRVFFERFMT